MASPTGYRLPLRRRSHVRARGCCVSMLTAALSLAPGVAASPTSPAAGPTSARSVACAWRGDFADRCAECCPVGRSRGCAYGRSACIADCCTTTGTWHHGQLARGRCPRVGRGAAASASTAAAASCAPLASLWPWLPCPPVRFGLEAAPGRISLGHLRQHPFSARFLRGRCRGGPGRGPRRGWPTWSPSAPWAPLVRGLGGGGRVREPSGSFLRLPLPSIVVDVHRLCLSRARCLRGAEAHRRRRAQDHRPAGSTSSASPRLLSRRCRCRWPPGRWCLAPRPRDPPRRRGRWHCGPPAAGAIAPLALRPLALWCATSSRRPRRWCSRTRAPPSPAPSPMARLGVSVHTLSIGTTRAETTWSAASSTAFPSLPAHCAFCELSLDQSPGTAGAAGDFGHMVLTSADLAGKQKKRAAAVASGRLAMMANFGLFSQDCLTGSARGDCSLLSAACRREQAGYTAPCWLRDPAGFTADS